MASYYGVNATLKRNEPSSMVDVTLDYGKIRYISDQYTLSGELPLDDRINLFKIPKGARVIEMMITAPSDGTTGQYDVGWLASEEQDEDGVALEAADPDGFYVGSVADTGGGALARLAVAATRPGYRKKFAAEVQVQLDVIEATTASTGDTILLEAYIVVE